jgi:hypothetical protein
LDDESAFVSGVASAGEPEAGKAGNCAGVVENCAARLGNDGVAREVACSMAGGGSGSLGLAPIGTAEIAGALAAPELPGGTARSLKFGVRSGADRLITGIGLVEVTEESV